jgi:hypothetical protein
LLAAAAAACDGVHGGESGSAHFGGKNDDKQIESSERANECVECKTKSRLAATQRMEMEERIVHTFFPFLFASDEEREKSLPP